MAKDGVKIPVTVTGAEQAQQQLAATGEGIVGVGQAAQQAATGMRQLAQASGDADEKAFRSWRGDQRRPFSTDDIQLQSSTADIQLEPAAAVAGMQAQAAAATKANAATQALAGGLVEVNAGGKLFSMEGGRAFRGVLSAINPELGAAFGMATNVTQSLVGMSVTMLGMAGAAAVIGGLVAIYNSWAEGAERTAAALERIRAFQDKARTRGAEERRDIVQEGAQIAGFVPNAADVQAQVAALQRERGVPPELGRSVGIAEQFARERGVPFERETYLAGLVVSGAKPADLGTTITEAQRAIRDVQRAGAAPDAARALATYLHQVGPEQMAGAPSPAEQVRESLDVAMGQIATEQQGRYQDAELRAAAEIVRQGLLTTHPDKAGMYAATEGIVKPSRFRWPVRFPDSMGPEQEPSIEELPANLGGAATIGDIVALARDAARRADEMGPGPVGREVPETQPVIVNNNYYQTINVDRVESVPGGFRSGMLPGMDGLPGGGVQD